MLRRVVQQLGSRSNLQSRLTSIRLHQPCRHLGVTSAATSTEDITTVRARLLYQSKKRGILECDLILGGFAEENLQRMDMPALHDYDALINGNHNEWDIYAWVTRSKPFPMELTGAGSIEKLQKFVESSKSDFRSAQKV